MLLIIGRSGGCERAHTRAVQSSWWLWRDDVFADARLWVSVRRMWPGGDGGVWGGKGRPVGRGRGSGALAAVLLECSGGGARRWVSRGGVPVGGLVCLV